MRRRFSIAALVAASFILTLMLPSAPAGAVGDYHFVIMYGAEEAPTQADLDGKGVFAWQIARGHLCYVLTAHDIDRPTVAHIHRAPRRVAGPIVVALRAPVDGFSSGCIRAEPTQTAQNADQVLTCDELDDIIANPTLYYANVHNARFPSGAIRGQMTGPMPTPSTSPSAMPTHSPAYSPMSMTAPMDVEPTMAEAPEPDYTPPY